MTNARKILAHRGFAVLAMVGVDHICLGLDKSAEDVSPIKLRVYGDGSVWAMAERKCLYGPIDAESIELCDILTMELHNGKIRLRGSGYSDIFKIGDSIYDKAKQVILYANIGIAYPIIIEDELAEAVYMDMVKR